MGDTLEEVEASIREAIAFHIEGIQEEGLPQPKPTSISKMVEVGQ